MLFSKNQMATLSFWVMMMSSKQSKMKWVSPSHIFFHFLSPFLFFYFWGIKYRECLKSSIQKLHLYNNSEVEILLSFGLLLPTPISRILFQSLLLWVYDLMFMCTCPQIYIYMHAHTHTLPIFFPCHNPVSSQLPWPWLQKNIPMWNWAGNIFIYKTILLTEKNK